MNNSKYIPTYSCFSDSDETLANTVEQLNDHEGEGSELEEIVENCKELGISAILRDEPGFNKGYVEPTGDYILR